MSDQPAPEPSDAILTIPNLLSFFRLALIPLFLWLALGPDRIDLAVVVSVAGLATDLIDGKVARRYGQVSKLGIALDPLSDRLGIAAGGAVLIVHGLAPLWAVLAVVGRDALLVLVGAPILKATGAEIPPVSRVGKYGSFGTSVAVGLFLLAGWSGVTMPNATVRAVAWVVFALSIPLYWAAGWGYVRAGLRALRERRAA
ncbi:MAG TPA: CDP-alcohol phosphatidyltransferase family protein [Actinomycetota bacterium]